MDFLFFRWTFSCLECVVFVLLFLPFLAVVSFAAVVAVVAGVTTVAGVTNGVSIKMSITKDVYCNGQQRDDSKRTTRDDSKRKDSYGRYLIITCAKKVVQSCQRVHLEQNDSENHLPHSKNSQLLKKPPKTPKTTSKVDNC